MANKPKLTLPEMLGAYGDSGAARFHMPGHKGRGMTPFLGEELGRWDVTEISCTDNLHDPQGAILEGQKRLAAAYGAEASFYVVNGGTAAIHAMILSLGREEKLLLSRDCHKSAIGAVALSGIETVFMTPRYHPELELLELITPAELDAALEETGATAVLVTSPNYYGLCADLPGLAAVAHSHGALLLVDGAHGAHFPFSKALPEACGESADLWCHSQHKTLNALTQSASLHVGKCRIKPEKVAEVLALIETTSPSFLLMASLDYATYTAGRQDWDGLCRRVEALERKISGLPGLSLLSERDCRGAVEKDPTRLVIDVSGRGITGYEAQAHLEQQNIYIEMADAWRLVLILSPEDDPKWYERLYQALLTLPYGRLIRRGLGLPQIADRMAVSVREATFAKSSLIPLKQAQDRIPTRAVGIYPPGIALFVPGERLSREGIDALLSIEQAGGHIFGVRNGMVSVMEEEG